MPPQKRTIIAPEGGWVAQAYYVVDVAMAPDNPIHRAIFHVGFLRGDTPAGYNAIMKMDNEDPVYRFDRLHYMKAVCEITEMRRTP